MSGWLCGKRYWLWPGDRSATCTLPQHHRWSCSQAADPVAARVSVPDPGEDNR